MPFMGRIRKGVIEMKTNEKQNKQRKEEEDKVAEEMFKATRLYYI